jgi:hypothetical protein
VLPAKAAGTYDVVLSNSDSQTANTKTYTYRNDPASVTLSAQPSSELGLAIPVTATFDKDVTGFDATAVTVSPSGSVQSWQGSGKSYQFEIVPAVQGLLQIQINGANIRDAIGNTGIKTPASLTVSVTTPTDSVSLNTQGVLEIHLASAGSQATLFPDQGFYRITGNKIQKQTFNMTAVNQISVKGNLLPDQTFRLGASNGTGVVHPLAVDENVDVTFILGIVNSRGNVAINSRQVVLGADITSVGSQTYKAAVEISGNRNLSSTSSITFNGSIDSSLLIFADPDSAPERTDLTKNFPNITLTLVTKAKPGWAEQEYTVAARKSWIVRSPTEVFAPTGNYLFGYSFDDDGRLGLNVSDGTFLRARFSLPVRQVAFDFTPNSSDPSVNGYPYLQVFTDSFWGDDENPWYLVPERVWEKLWGNRAGADVLSVSSLSSGTLRAPADISRDTRPIRRAEASWISASEWSEGSIDHLQATLWQKPIVTLSLTGQANLPGNVGERLRIITNGSVSKSVAPHAFAGGWSGYLAFTQNGQRSASQFQLTLGQTETQVTGTLQSANGNFNGVVSGMVTDDDFNGTLTLSSGPCTGTSIPFKLTEFENEGNIQLGDAGACSDYAPQMYRMQRSR